MESLITAEANQQIIRLTPTSQTNNITYVCDVLHFNVLKRVKKTTSFIVCM